MVSLTKKQREILSFIENFIERKGYSPSYREIAAHFKLSSPSTIFEHIKNLAAKGFITASENEARSIELTSIPQGDLVRGDIATIPLAGMIAAGEPIEAVQQQEELAVPASLADDSGRFFALKVKGESMIDDGIFDGDYVVVERRDAARNGEIVVALIDNEYATLKRFYKERDHIRLEPANASMEPIRVKNVKIQGRLVGLIRKYA